MPSVLAHLGRACLLARREAQLRQIDIAVVAGVSHTIIGRFENGAGVPRDLDRVVQAYADECNVEAVALWTSALLSRYTEPDA